MDKLISADDLDPDLTVTVSARELVDLFGKLESQPTIEEAKGIVMGHYGLNAETAFGVLRRWSQQGNVKLHIVAQALVEGVATRQPGQDVPPHDLITRALDLDPPRPATH